MAERSEKDPGIKLKPHENLHAKQDVNMNTSKHQCRGITLTYLEHTVNSAFFYKCKFVDHDSGEIKVDANHRATGQRLNPQSLQVFLLKEKKS